jgi:flagellin-specific chaperone FliS
MIEEKISSITKDVISIYDNEVNSNYNTSEEIVNEFLDTIILFKQDIQEQNSRLEKIISSIEELTWIVDYNDSDLEKLKSLILSCKGLYTDLVTHYVRMNKPNIIKLAKQEIKTYKMLVDGFKEAYQDVNSKFFILPNIQDFKDAESGLESI